MFTFWIALAALFIGTGLGMLVMAMFAVSGHYSREEERCELNGWTRR